MTALKAHEVGRFVDRPDIDRGIFLAYGPDAGLVRETGQRLARRFAGADADSMNLLVLDAAELEIDPSRLALEAKTISLFGERRVLRVRNAGKSLTTALADLADDIGEAAVVLEAGNLLPRDPLRALIEKSPVGRALPCYPDTDQSITALISESFSKAGIAAEPDAITALRESLGNDREVTRRELEKLLLFAADSKRLTREDVLTLCADNGALVLDQIIDSVAAGHPTNLDAALERAVAANVASQQILISTLNHFAALRRWRTEVDAGKSPSQVLDNARPRPHFSRKSGMERQLRLWTDAALSTALERLQTAVSETRRHYDLQLTLTRRGLMAVCLMAAER